MTRTKWYGTILCLTGITLTSYNVYPLNIVFGFFGSLLWTYAGYVQKDKPLFLVEIVAVLVYLSGIVNYLL